MFFSHRLIQITHKIIYIANNKKELANPYKQFYLSSLSVIFVSFYIFHRHYSLYFVCVYFYDY